MFQSWFSILETANICISEVLFTWNSKPQDFNKGCTQISKLTRIFLWKMTFCLSIVSIFFYSKSEGNKMERLNEGRPFYTTFMGLFLNLSCFPSNKGIVILSNKWFFLFNLSSTQLLYSVSPLKLVLSMVLNFLS